MEQSTLETISITALVVSLIVFAILVIRWIVKRWFVGTWADKIIGGKQRMAFPMKDTDITDFKNRCLALQKDLIEGTPITNDAMKPIVNMIYLAFGCDDSHYKRITNKLKNKHRRLWCEAVTDGLKSAPLAALILMACPYMFNIRIRMLYDETSYYNMLTGLGDYDALMKNQFGVVGQEGKKFLIDNYFMPICDAIHDDVTDNITEDYIRATWSDSGMTPRTLFIMFSIKLKDNKLKITTENIAKALKDIVIPDVYETLIANGDNLPDSHVESLKNLPAIDEPRYKMQ